MNSPQRGLVIGAGYFAQFHLDAWRRVKGAEIAGVCDSDLDKAQKACVAFEIQNAYSDVEQAISKLQPDFLDIITPPGSHLDLVARAAAHQIDVICQKPLAPDLSTSQQIADAAKASGTRLMVHENFRFQPWHREIKRLIECGAIGDRLHSLHFRTRTGDGWSDDAYLDRQPYFRAMPRLLVHETGVHFIDTFRYLAGEVVSAHAILRRLNKAIQGEDACMMTLQFENGAVGVWDASRFNESTDDNPRLTFGQFLIEGNAGSIRLYGDGRMTIQPLGETEREHDYQFDQLGFAGDCVRATQQHFIDALLSGEPFETSAEEYLKTLTVVEAAYESSQVGQTIYVKEQTSKLIDLSRQIENDLPGVEILPAKTIKTDGWRATTLTLYSHCGTHMDAPCHFLSAGENLVQQDLTACIGPAKVIDLTPVQPNELLTVERLGACRERINAGDRLLLRTDWHARYPSDEFRNALPRISRQLAEWFVARRVALIGVEPPSIANVNDLQEVTEIHQILFRGGVTIVEGLMNLDQLESEIVELIVLPLLVKDGDGSPVRAVARQVTEND